MELGVLGDKTQTNGLEIALKFKCISANLNHF